MLGFTTCNKPSANFLASNNLYSAHRSAVGADLVGEISPDVHFVKAGAGPSLSSGISWRLSPHMSGVWCWPCVAPPWGCWLECLDRTQSFLRFSYTVETEHRWKTLHTLLHKNLLLSGGGSWRAACTAPLLPYLALCTSPSLSFILYNQQNRH